jgi:threonine dehydrogenase-like Zn-dependent dehydrogenase
MIVEEKIDVDFMFTHRFRLDQTKQALDLVTEYRDGVVKAVIEI